MNFALSVASKLPFGATSAIWNVLRVRLWIFTVSRLPAVPCVAAMVVRSPTGMLALMAPAGGVGRGAVSMVVNVLVNSASAWRPVASASAVLTRTRCAVVADSAWSARNVATRFPSLNAAAPATPAPPTASSESAPMLAGSIGSENVMTTGAPSATSDC